MSASTARRCLHLLNHSRALDAREHLLKQAEHMIRFGLCCLFNKEPIRFRRATATYLQKFSRREQLLRLSALCLHNGQSLFAALEYCNAHGIKSFRINSQILPLKTHPAVGYRVEELPEFTAIRDSFKQSGAFCRAHDMRTTFHPDQFILLSSPTPEITRRSRADLAYHAEVAAWVHADVITIHAGGTYGSKQETLMRLRKNIERLPEAIRSRLTLENDDRSYTPKDLLPVCSDTGVPLAYDVHHHRCLPDGKNEIQTTELALRTWDREPLFHLSSPLHGWKKGVSRQHHDYIKLSDFPECWKGLDVTIEVEAKAKERAVLQIMKKIHNK
jgi:UV DNA damage endonuclease